MSNKQELIDCTWKFNSRDAQDGLRVIRRSITGLGCEGDPRRTIAFVAEFIDLCDGDPKDALAQLEALDWEQDDENLISTHGVAVYVD